MSDRSMPRLSVVKFGAIGLLLISSVTSAGECTQTRSRCMKAAALVDALHYRDSLRSLSERCQHYTARYRPEEMVKKDGTMFAGVTPGSPKWTRIAEAFDDYQTAACDEGLAAMLLNTYRQAWADALDDEELDATLVFLKSRAGRSFGLKQPMVYKTISDQSDAAFGQRQQDAYLRYYHHVQAILKE
jgi:hypothetical protein